MEGGRGCGDALPSDVGGVGVVLSQPPGSYSSWTHAGVLGVLTVLQTMPHTSL